MCVEVCVCRCVLGVVVEGCVCVCLCVCVLQKRPTVFEDLLRTVDIEIKIPTVENPELTDDVPLKPGIGQNITTHALPTARNFFPVLISAFPVHSLSFYFRSSPCL